MHSCRSVMPAALALSLACSACCSVSPPRSQFPTADAALQRMKDTYACARGVQGEGRLDHQGDSGRIRGNVMLMAVDPANVRFDVYSPFGVMIATLTSDGERFSFFDIRSKQFLTGPPDPCNIARLTQVRMPAHALVRLMRGEAPLLVHTPGSATIEWDSCGYYVVTIPSTNESTQTVHLAPVPEDFNLPFEKQRVRVLQVTVKQRDFVHYRADLMDHKPAVTMPPRQDPDGIDPDIPPSGPACRVDVPQRIRFVMPNTGDDMLFRYEDTGLNPPLVDRVFEQTIPGGVQVREVRCP